MILIRHGESQANAGNAAPKNNLTKKGKEQAARLAKELAGEKIDQIYCSNTDRCIETMEAIIQDRNDDIGISLCHLISPKKKTEDFEVLRKRVKRFIEDLKIEFGEETVVIISHQLVIRMLWYELTGKDEAVENGEMRTVIISNQ